MPLCLLTDPWLPVRRRSGARDTVAPPAIAATEADPIVALDWPRPDFRMAGLEFLTGLLTLACPPRNTGAWVRGFHTPPDADALAEAFTPLAHAFVLDGDGPRFMQEREDFTAGANSVAALLIESPGANTVKLNTDLLNKRGQVLILSRAAVAMALFTLQAYAPAGGAGNRVGLRGGGPLTTMAIPPAQPGEGEVLLWHLLWSNVPCGEVPDEDELPRILPWLGPTRGSDKDGRPTTPDDVHELQAWWGMPRRIRLDFSDGAEELCSLTGQADTVVVRSWRQRPWGFNYSTWGKLHPLSPCYRTKPTEEWLYLHPQPGGIGYQHWLGLVSLDAGETRSVAPAVAEFRKVRAAEIGAGQAPWRLLAAGFDMDNMKARGFAESEMPVQDPTNPAAAMAHDALLRAMVRAASEVVRLLANSVRRALFSEGATVALDAAPLAALRDRFWGETEGAFFARVAAAAGGVGDDETRTLWLADIAREARRLFNEAAPVDASGEGHPGRIAAAARQMDFALRGYGKSGEAIFNALGAVLPEGARKAKIRKEKAA